MESLHAFNADRTTRAMKIASGVLSEIGSDGELLRAVLRQLNAVLGETGLEIRAPALPPNRGAGKSRNGRSKSRGRGAQKDGKTEKSSPSVESLPINHLKEEKHNPSQPQHVNIAAPKALVDHEGTKKSTWDNRLRSQRQRALEDFESFKQNASERTGAIFVNAYLTLVDGWEKYKRTPLFNRNKADPLRGLPRMITIRSLENSLKTTGWTQDIQNGHFVIQTQDGKSLRGEEIYQSVFSDVSQVKQNVV
jgi:hypothetical protein